MGGEWESTLLLFLLLLPLFLRLVLLPLLLLLLLPVVHSLQSGFGLARLGSPPSLPAPFLSRHRRVRTLAHRQ